MALRIRRVPGNPILRPGMDVRMGENLNGPSLLRVPDWVERPLGRYYLYFADHRGSYIRLAFADALEGPWTVFAPGVLPLEESLFPATRAALTGGDAALERLYERGFLYCHVASPDVHVDDARGEIRLYYHGWHEDRSQCSRVAISRNGLSFRALPEVLGPSYLRVFRWHGWHHALAMPGMLLRSRDGLGGFETGPQLFPDEMRHAGLLLRGEELLVFWTRVGDAPEHVLLSRIALRGDWRSWRTGEPESVLRPEWEWEGSDLPIAPSRRGFVAEPVHQLRDPAVFEEDGRTWLLYAVAGERGIALAELGFD
jgi:hypothetical protein